MPGQSWFFLTAALIVIIGLMYYNLRYSVDRLVQIMMGLIVAGALGNFIDRIRLRYVIDFFDLGWWPVFNIADMAVVVGGCLLLLHMFFFMKEG